MEGVQQIVPLLITIKENVVHDAVAYRDQEQLEAAFIDANRAHGRETNDHEMDDGYVDLEDMTLCMVWATRPEGEDPWQIVSRSSLQDWRDEVANDDTRLGYLDWVAHQREIAAEGNEEDEE